MRQKEPKSVLIDPVEMNIVNRIAPGTKYVGVLESEGGIIIQGKFEGSLTVNGGPLILTREGLISGVVVCSHDVYLMGSIGESPEGGPSEITSMGTAVIAASLRANANITAVSVDAFDGARVSGRISTLNRERRAA